MGREIERKENGKYCPSDDFQTLVWCRYVFYLSIFVENCERETEKIGETPNHATHAAFAGKMAAVSFNMDVEMKATRSCCSRILCGLVEQGLYSQLKYVQPCKLSR